MSIAEAKSATHRMIGYVRQNGGDWTRIEAGLMTENRALLTGPQRRRVKHKANKADAHQAIGVAYPSKRKRRIPIKPRLMYGGYGIHQVPPHTFGKGDE